MKAVSAKILDLEKGLEKAKEEGNVVEQEEEVGGALVCLNLKLFSFWVLLSVEVFDDAESLALCIVARVRACVCRRVLCPSRSSSSG